MQLLDIIIYVMMFYYTLIGYKQGAMGRKFYFEKNFLAIVFSPVLIPIFHPLLIEHMNFTLSMILSWVLGYVISMSLVILIYGRTISFVTKPDSTVDKFYGGFLGLVKGFLMAGVITFAVGVMYIDKVVPDPYSSNLKYSHAGVAFTYPINFYRYLIFSVASLEVDASIAYDPKEYNRKIKREYNSKHKW